MNKTIYLLFAGMLCLVLTGATKPWDQARFAQCIARSAADPLDPDEIVSTAGCREPDKVTKNDTAVTDLVVDRYVAFGKKKTATTWDGAIAFAIDYNRISSIVGGDAIAGFIAFNRVTILWAGGLEEYELNTVKRDTDGCSTLGNGWMRTTTCGYSERLLVPLTEAILTKAVAAEKTAPGQSIPIKLFSRSQGTIEAYLYPAEIAAAAAAAGI